MFIFVIFLLTYHFCSFGAVDLGSKLNSNLSTPKVRIVLGLDSEAKQKHLDSLKVELQAFQQEWVSYQEQATQKTTECRKQIEYLNNTTTYKSSSNIARTVNIYHKLIGIIEEIKETKLKIIELVQQNIEFLSKNITGNSQQQNLEEKSLYSFFEFQTVMKKYFLYEEQLRQMLLKKELLFQEITRQEHILATKEKDFNTIEQIIEDKKKSTDINKEDISLLDIERDLITKEREYASLKLILYQKQMDFLDNKESALQERVSSMIEQLKLIRSRLYIDVHEVQEYEKKLIEAKKTMEAKSLDLQEVKKQISSKKIQSQDELDRLRHRYKISIDNFQKFIDLDEDVRTISDRFNLYSVGYGLNSVITFDRMIQEIKSQLELFEELFNQAQISSKAVNLLYGITQGQTKDSETFEKERSDYKQFHQTLLNHIKKYKDMLLLVHTQIKENQKYMEYLKRQQEILQNSVLSLSSTQQKKLNDSLNLLVRLIEDIHKQHDILFQIGENYEQILQADEEALEAVKIILQEFEMIGVWHRPTTAVTWEGIRNIIPDIKLFLKNIYISVTTYISQLGMQKLAYDLMSFGFGGIVTLFLLFFLLFMIYLFLQALFPSLYAMLMSDAQDDDTDPLYRWKQLFTIFIGFSQEVFKPLYFWFLCFLYESFYDVSVALLIFFYIYSIVFWIYASRKLLQVFFVVNRKFDYFLLNKRLIDKFSFIYSFFSIATIIILVMRKMFIVVFAHEATELPNILLRIYHVVIFISIIFSLDKDEIVQLISKRTIISQRFAQIVEHYYYLFLLGIFSLLIMSDPYLGGYGSLVWHLFWNLFITIAIIGALFIIQAVIRQYSSVFFFEEQDGTVPSIIERFEHAKAWYAIYVVSSMLFITFLGILACSHVWGYGITFMTLKKILLHELFKIEAFNATGKIIPESFKVYNLLYILLVSLLGVLFAYLFKKFVLKRLFDIQYVDAGIQNTIIIISRYVIIICAVMLACVQSKLGYLVTYVSYVALVVFGWSFKDLFTDFVAYFFILVQRPVKLGDYVKIDDTTMGVVRKVGPRTVILRRKNSVSIVVPNSTILKSALYNWNYTRSYIGLEDIVFCVAFGSDIQLVKKICLEVLDEDQDVLKVPQPFVRLDSFDDKGYLFLVRGFVSSGNTLRQWDIASNIRFNLVDKLSKAGVQIAGPSVKVFIKNNSVDIEKFMNDK
jgi:small-conductance mechanosensitive channel